MKSNYSVDVISYFAVLLVCAPFSLIYISYMGLFSILITFLLQLEMHYQTISETNKL